MGRNVPKRDSSASYGVRCWISIDQKQILDGEVLDADEPACVELVPVTQTVRWSPKAAWRGPIRASSPI